jgi:hypothetical protein
VRQVQRTRQGTQDSQGFPKKTFFLKKCASQFWKQKFTKENITHAERQFAPLLQRAQECIARADQEDLVVDLLGRTHFASDIPSKPQPVSLFVFIF